MCVHGSSGRRSTRATRGASLALLPLLLALFASEAGAHRDLASLARDTDPGYDDAGRDVAHLYRNVAGQVRFGWRFTWNGPDGVGTSRLASEHRVHGFPRPLTQPPHLDTHALDSAYRQVGFVRNSVLPSGRVLDGTNAMTAFFEEGLDRAPVVDGVPAEAGMAQYSSFAGFSRTYTPTGALATDGVLEREWDASDRLAHLRTQATHALLGTYAYSADGRRVLAVEGGLTTRTLWSGWSPLFAVEAVSTPPSRRRRRCGRLLPRSRRPKGACSRPRASA